MNKIILHHHTGLGDHFICNGLVHSFANTFDEVNLICKKSFSKTVTHLYEDRSDKIKILPVENEIADISGYVEKLKMDIYRVGFDKCDLNNFEESFYKQYGLDPMMEYYGFFLPTNMQGSKLFYQKILQSKGKDYIIVHDTCTYAKFNLKIDSELPRHTVKKSDTNDVLDYVDFLCNAKEIHVINSGLNNLVFQLYYKKLLTGKVFYHDARKLKDGGIPVKVLDGIEIVNYD